MVGPRLGHLPREGAAPRRPRGRHYGTDLRRPVDPIPPAERRRVARSGRLPRSGPADLAAPLQGGGGTDATRSVTRRARRAGRRRTRNRCRAAAARSCCPGDGSRRDGSGPTGRGGRTGLCHRGRRRPGSRRPDRRSDEWQRQHTRRVAVEPATALVPVFAHDAGPTVGRSASASAPGTGHPDTAGSSSSSSITGTGRTGDVCPAASATPPGRRRAICRRSHRVGRPAARTDGTGGHRTARPRQEAPVRTDSQAIARGRGRVSRRRRRCAGSHGSIADRHPADRRCCPEAGQEAALRPDPQAAARGRGRRSRDGSRRSRGRGD